MEKFPGKLIHFFYDEKFFGSYQGYEGYEILFYISWPQFGLQQFHGRFWQEECTPGSEKKTLLLTVQQVASTLLSLQLLLGITWINPSSIQSWFVSQLKNLEFRKSESFIMDIKQIYLNFIMERAIILMIVDSKQTCPLYSWEVLTLSSQVAYYRALSISASICTKMRQIHRFSS